LRLPGIGTAVPPSAASRPLKSGQGLDSFRIPYPPVRREDNFRAARNYPPDADVCGCARSAMLTIMVRYR